MRYVTFQRLTDPDGTDRVGLVHGEEILDLSVILGAFLRDARRVVKWSELANALVSDMLTLIGNGAVAAQLLSEALLWFGDKNEPRAISDRQAVYPHTGVRLRAPVPRPVAIRDFMTFEEHARGGYARRGQELPQEWFDIPIHYRSSTTNLAGHHDPIMWPSYTDRLDYELEIAACIGRGGRNIAPAAGIDHIFGFTIFNDVSARDIQYREMRLNLGPAKGKNFDNSSVMGPCLVTADELELNDLACTISVNGEIWSETSTQAMYHSFGAMVAYASLEETLHPGEFLCSGTLPQGCGADIGRWLRPGDELTLYVQGIGMLSNRVQRASHESL